MELASRQRRGQPTSGTCSITTAPPASPPPAGARTPQAPSAPPRAANGRRGRVTPPSRREREKGFSSPLLGCAARRIKHPARHRTGGKERPRTEKGREKPWKLQQRSLPSPSLSHAPRGLEVDEGGAELPRCNAWLWGCKVKIPRSRHCSTCFFFVCSRASDSNSRFPWVGDPPRVWFPDS